MCMLTAQICSVFEISSSCTFIICVFFYVYILNCPNMIVLWSSLFVSGNMRTYHSYFLIALLDFQVDSSHCFYILVTGILKLIKFLVTLWVWNYISLILWFVLCSNQCISASFHLLKGHVDFVLGVPLLNFHLP